MDGGRAALSHTLLWNDSKAFRCHELRILGKAITGRARSGVSKRRVSLIRSRLRMLRRIDRNNGYVRLSLSKTFSLDCMMY